MIMRRRAYGLVPDSSRISSFSIQNWTSYSLCPQRKFLSQSALIRSLVTVASNVKSAKWRLVSTWKDSSTCWQLWQVRWTKAPLWELREALWWSRRVWFPDYCKGALKDMGLLSNAARNSYTRPIYREKCTPCTTVSSVFNMSTWFRNRSIYGPSWQ